MTRVIFGIVLSTGVLTVVVFGTRQVRRRLVPTWAGPESVLADIVVTLGVLTVVSDVLGALGWFATLPIAVGLVVAGVLAHWWGWSPQDVGNLTGVNVSTPKAPRSHGNQRKAKLGATVAVAGVVGTWLSNVPFAYRHGILGWDSLWYHLPAAANFVQTGSFVPLKLYDADSVVATYPFGSSVFHALGMLSLGSDIISPLINFGWLAIALLAAHVFGRRFGVQHLAVVAAAIVFATPVVIELESVSALAEMMALAGLLAALAFLVTPVRGSSTGRYFLVGLAAGLAAAAKLIMLGPAVAVVAAAILLARRERARSSRFPEWSLLVGFIATGGFWYFRDIVRFGSPLPEVKLGIGHYALPVVHVDGSLGPMFPTLVSPQWFRPYVGPSLMFGLGPGFVLMLVVLFGVGIQAFRKTVAFELRVAGALTWVMLAFGVASPQYLWHSIYAAMLANLRYVLPALLVGLVTASATLRRRTDLGWFVFGFTYLAALLTYLMRPVRDTAIARQSTAVTWTMWAWVIGTIAGAVVLVAVIRRVPASARGRSLSCMAAVGLVGVLVGVAPTYLSHRYDGSITQAELQQWSRTHSGRRIAAEPFDFADNLRRSKEVHTPTGRIETPRSLLYSYALLGPTFANRVDPTVTFTRGRTVRPTSCHEWWTVLRRLDATDVLVWTPTDRPRTWSSYARWTLQSPDARLEVRSQTFSGGVLWLYHLGGVDRPPC